jgi:RNA polymerase sigma-70 factor (ECF subfamily)
MSDLQVPPEQLRAWLTQGALGDEAACAALYGAFSSSVLHLALGMLNDLADAEEVTQDTFIYALRNLGRFDPARSAFRTWLFTIAISRCHNKRRRKWLTLLPLEWLVHETSGMPERAVEMALARRGVRRQVWETLQGLSPRLREAVVLRYFGGLPYKEIGQVMGCNSKTAESRVRRGLTAMRRTLRQSGLEAELEWAEFLAGG